MQRVWFTSSLILWLASFPNLSVWAQESDAVLQHHHQVGPPHSSWQADEPKPRRGGSTPPGLWLLPRKDAANTARADVPGRMRAAPVELWSIGPSRRPTHNVWPVGRDLLVQSGSSLERVKADGRRVWLVPDAGVSGLVGVLEFGDGGDAALASVGGGNLVLFDLTRGRPVWRWAPPPQAEQGGPILWRDGSRYRLAVFPQNTVDGTVFEFSSPTSAPTELWHQSYTNKFYPNFGPFGVVADMNNDGRPDILLAAKPSYVAALDGDTGRILFDLHYPIAEGDHVGRPYGLIQAVDLDGDGFRDAVVASCQVEEYIGIVRNVGGKAFTLAWSKFIEHDLPHDDRELRPQTTSCVDIDGDGKREFVAGLYNVGGDGRWHTVVFDALGGWEARKLDLSGRYFWGCYDLDGDGRPEVVTSDESERRTAPVLTKLLAVDGRTGRDTAVLEKAQLMTPNRPLPLDTAFHANRATPTLVNVPGQPKGLLVRTPEGERLWSVSGGKNLLTPFAPGLVARLIAFGTADGPLERPERTIGKPVPEVSSAYGPMVSFADGAFELIVCRSDGSVEGGRPVPDKPGTLAHAWSVRGVNPAVWIGPEGERLVGVFDREKDQFHVYRPRAGERDAVPVLSVKLPFLPYRSAGMLLPFGENKPSWYVGMKTGVHTIAGALYSADGQLLWRDDLEGPYPRPAGVVPGTVQPRLVVDNHGKILLYGENGSKTMIAHGWNNTIPGRGNGAKYALPIIGPYAPDGGLRIVLAGGLENLEILDLDGARRAMVPTGSIYEQQFAGPAVARRPDGLWSLGTLSNQGVFHCQDLVDGRERWRLDLGVKPTGPTRVVAGDVDGNGQEEFLVGLSDGQLVALAERRQAPRRLWSMRVDAAIRDVVLADVNGDGSSEIVIETDDGKVRLLGPRKRIGVMREPR